MLARRRHARRCRKLAAACANETMRRYLEAAAELHPGSSRETPMIAADLELTGLDPDSDQIVAVGWTLIDTGRIRIGSNRHLLVQTGRSVGNSATVHELLDHEVAGGVALEDALDALFTAARGRVWIFHHAPLDIAFLRKACAAWSGSAPPFAALDTLALERSRRQRREQPVRPGDLQLGVLREAYGLPSYAAHNALLDAFATAELVLAMLAHSGSAENVDLGRLVGYH